MVFSSFFHIEKMGNPSSHWDFSSGNRGKSRPGLFSGLFNEATSDSILLRFRMDFEEK